MKKLWLAGLSTAVLAGLLAFLLLRGSASRKPPQADRPAFRPPAIRLASPTKVSHGTGQPDVKPKDAAVAPPETDDSLQRTICGRIVRLTGGAAETPVPVEGVKVRLKSRGAGIEEALLAHLPRLQATRPDGRFEFEGVPVGVWLRLEIDEPSSALRAFNFALHLEGARRRELGDIALEPGTDLVVKLLGQEEQPIEKGHVLVSAEEFPFQDFDFHESGRWAKMWAAECTSSSERFPDRTPSRPELLHTTPPEISRSSCRERSPSSSD
jgi:hypothetical protein